MEKLRHQAPGDFSALAVAIRAMALEIPFDWLARECRQKAACFGAPPVGVIEKDRIHPFAMTCSGLEVETVGDQRCNQTVEAFFASVELCFCFADTVNTLFT